MSSRRKKSRKLDVPVTTLSLRLPDDWNTDSAESSQNAVAYTLTASADTTVGTGSNTFNKNIEISLRCQRKRYSLDEVGLQLWKASFVLCDYLLHIRRDIESLVLFEYGCGPGLVGIVCSLLTSRGIFCTDYKYDVLDLAASNLSLNKDLLQFSSRYGTDIISFRLLDWLDQLNFRELESATSSWSRMDINTLSSSECLFLAADVVYDDELTLSLFATIKKTMRRNERLLLTLEKRYNFSIADLDMVATGYKTFLSQFSSCQTSAGHVDSSNTCLRGRMIPLDFPQVFHDYTRDSYLELWEITCI